MIYVTIFKISEDKNSQDIQNGYAAARQTPRD